LLSAFVLKLSFAGPRELCPEVGRNEKNFSDLRAAGSPCCAAGMSATVQAKATRGWQPSAETVRDNKGMPWRGRDSVNPRRCDQIVRQTRTAGRQLFSEDSGRPYSLSNREGFNDVLFSSVQVNPSAEIAYRDSIWTADSPNTLVINTKIRER